MRVFKLCYLNSAPFYPRNENDMTFGEMPPNSESVSPETSEHTVVGTMSVRIRRRRAQRANRRVRSVSVFREVSTCHDTRKTIVIGQILRYRTHTHSGETPPQIPTCLEQNEFKNKNLETFVKDRRRDAKNGSVENTRREITAMNK